MGITGGIHDYWKQDQPFDGGNTARAWELFDLSRDPGELNDLATERPQIVEELGAAFLAWQKQMAKPVALQATFGRDRSGPVNSPGRP